MHYSSLARIQNFSESTAYFQKYRINYPHLQIVFVASNFVGENGDMAILDDIELSYDRNGEECIQVCSSDWLTLTIYEHPTHLNGEWLVCCFDPGQPNWIGREEKLAFENR